MAKTALGIDIGSTQLKLSWITCNLKGIKSFQNSCLSIPLTENSAESVSWIESQVANQPVPDSIVISVNSKQALFHNLYFPFSQQGKIKEVLPFELENSLPVELDAYSFDFLFSGQKREQGNEVITALYPKKLLNELLSALERCGLYPDRVDLDLAVLARVSEEIISENDKNILILDIGWSKTNLVWRQGTKVIAFRCLFPGLGGLIGGLDRDLKPTDIEEIKAFFDELEQKNDQDKILRPFQDLKRQILLTLMAAQSESFPEKIFLTGGGSQNNFIHSFLQENLQIRTMSLPQVLDLDQSCPEETVLAAMAARKKNHERKGYNLLHDELSKRRQKIVPPPHRQFLLFAVPILFFLVLSTFFLNISVQKHKLAVLQGHLQDTFKKIVPSAPASLQPIQYTSILRSRIAAQRSASIKKNIPMAKAINVLIDISKSLSSELAIQVTHFAMDKETVRLDGVASDFNTVDIIKKRLSKIKQFSEVSIVGANADEKNKRVRFNLRILLAKEND
ncbi:MAG: pilus assembly protein PilM [Thermodesulfobacteriota bacterium]